MIYVEKCDAYKYLILYQSLRISRAIHLNALPWLFALRSLLNYIESSCDGNRCGSPSVLVVEDTIVSHRRTSENFSIARRERLLQRNSRIFDEALFPRSFRQAQLIRPVRVLSQTSLIGRPLVCGFVSTSVKLFLYVRRKLRGFGT